MKSKTYFFNKAIFLKNMTLYWPIWVLYLLYGLIKVPGRLWFGLQKYSDAEAAASQALAECLSLKLDIPVIALVATLCAMSVFGYLFNTRSVYMLHALPVTRSEFFFTNILSGLSFLIVPQILVFFAAVLFCLANGISSVQYVGIWLLSVMGISFFMTAFAAFCAMLTGLLFALPVFFVLLNYAAVGCSVGLRLLLSQLGYGISYNTTPDIRILRFLSPLYELMGAVSIASKGGGINYSGGAVAAAYALAAVLVYALACFCYIKRSSECAGDLVAFAWLKPVFRWLVGLGAGYTAAILINSFVDGIPLAGSLVCAGFAVYFVTDMFIQKSFRVFTARRLRESVLFLGFTAASYGCVCAAATGVENYVPDGDKVESAYLYMNYPVEFDGESAEGVTAVHRRILEHGKEIQALVNSDETEEILTVSLIYHMKNGSTTERLYQLPGGTDYSEEIADTLYEYETEPDSFMKYIIGMDYEDITDFEEAEIEIDSAEDDYEGHVLDEEEAAQVYKAVCADAKEGTLQKYNLHAFGEQEESDMYLYLVFNHTSDEWEDVFDAANGSVVSELYNGSGASGDEGSAAGYLNISFGKDCENIMSVLREEGIID